MFWPRQMYAVDPIDELMRQWAVLPQPLSGHRLILNISASPFWHGKLEVRQRMIGALAKRHRATVVMVNQVGANDSLIFDGGSFAVGPDGEVFAQAKSFVEDLLVFETEERGAVRSLVASRVGLRRWGTRAMLGVRIGSRRPGRRWCWGLGIICGSAGSERRLWG
jgi:predicted amidohydrolase